MSTHTVPLTVLTTQEPELWRSALPARQSVFGSLEFASIMEKHRDRNARLFILHKDGGTVTYPVFLRPVSELPFAGNRETEGWDTVSPEYTGPLPAGPVSALIGKTFRECFDEYCKEKGVVAEFAHLHPWECSPDALIPEYLYFDREIVFVALEQSEDQLWHNSLTYACRKNIKRARRENVVVLPAQTPQHIQEFHRIYIHTMRRNRALDQYFFPMDFFMAFFEQMPDHARFALAEHNGRIIAGTLFLHDDYNVYSYLGGADYAYQHMRPANAVIYETIRWAQMQGKRRLVLGGGYGPNDGILRFKGSFSPLRARFHVYKHIHLHQEYVDLCQAWAAYHQCELRKTGYFPAYRSFGRDAEQSA